MTVFSVLWKRLLFTFVLVFASYNLLFDSRYSIYGLLEWLYKSDYSFRWPLMLTITVVLLVLFLWLLNVTLNGLGIWGIVAVFAIAGALVWLIIALRGDQGLPPASFWIWTGQIVLALFLGIGMSWGKLQRILTGQYLVDDNGEG